jgi:phosphoribosylformylglycinamidine synthase
VSFAREFSSSEYSKSIAAVVSGEPPVIDLAAEKRLIDCLVALAAEGVLESAHDLSDGGLAVALAESCFASSSAAPASAGGVLVGAQHAAPHLGNQTPRRHSERSEESLFSSLSATINLNDNSPAEFSLFCERGARAIVSLAPENLAAVLALARQYNVAAREIGKVTRGDAFRIELKGRAVIESPVALLRDAWANSLERTLALR